MNVTEFMRTSPKYQIRQKTLTMNSNQQKKKSVKNFAV